MGIAKRVTVNAKVTEEEHERLRSLAERENISITGLLKLLVKGLLEGEIEVKKGAVKSCPTTDEMGLSGILKEGIEENIRYKELRLDRLVSVFEERGYPDHIVRQQVEMMIGQVVDGGKYNPRKGSSDWGC